MDVRAASVAMPRQAANTIFTNLKRFNVNRLVNKRRSIGRQGVEQSGIAYDQHLITLVYNQQYEASLFYCASGQQYTDTHFLLANGCLCNRGVFKE